MPTDAELLLEILARSERELGEAQHELEVSIRDLDVAATRLADIRTAFRLYIALASVSTQEEGDVR